MFTVALVGADGAGKTTLTHKLEDSLSLPAKYVYMGINLESSNLLLPTTRLLLEVKRLSGKRPDTRGPFDPKTNKPDPKGAIKRALSGIKSSLRTTNTLAEEWFRAAVVTYYRRRGYIVLLDRHFLFDYYFHHILKVDQRLPITDRLHGLMLEKFYPRPDLVICLDAPAQVLYDRKNEASLELLENRRQEYLQLGEVVKNFVIVDASRSLEQVMEEVSRLICEYYLAWNLKHGRSSSKSKRGSS